MIKVQCFTYSIFTLCDMLSAEKDCSIISIYILDTLISYQFAGNLDKTVIKSLQNDLFLRCRQHLIEDRQNVWFYVALAEQINHNLH